MRTVVAAMRRHSGEVPAKNKGAPRRARRRDSGGDDEGVGGSLPATLEAAERRWAGGRKMAIAGCRGEEMAWNFRGGLRMERSSCCSLYIGEAAVESTENA